MLECPTCHGDYAKCDHGKPPPKPKLLTESAIRAAERKAWIDSQAVATQDGWCKVKTASRWRTVPRFLIGGVPHRMVWCAGYGPELGPREGGVLARVTLNGGWTVREFVKAEEANEPS